MFIGTGQFLTKHKKDRVHDCPHTIVYELDVPRDNYTYSILLKNSESLSGATMDWGDGTVQTDLYSTADAISGRFYYDGVSHTYATSGTYTLKFDINDVSSLYEVNTNKKFSLFGLYYPPNLDKHFIPSSNYLNRNSADDPADIITLNTEDRLDAVIRVIDFNTEEICSALWCWPIFAGISSVYMSNRLFQRINSHVYQNRACYNSLTSPIRHFELSNTIIKGNGFCNFSELETISLSSQIYHGFTGTNFADNIVCNVRYRNNEYHRPEVRDVFYNTNFKSCHLNVIGVNDSFGIGGNLFQECRNLQFLTTNLPYTVVYTNSFRACDSLTDSTVNFQGVSEKIDGGAFAYCTSLTGANLNDNCSIINESAFESCTSLSYVHLPSSLTLIQKNTFKYTSSLKNIDISYLNLENIYSNAFHGSGLTGFVIPSSVENWTVANMSAHIEVFCDSKIQYAEFQNHPKVLPDGFFKYCKELTSVILPDSIETLSKNAFDTCNRLCSITLPQNLTTLDTGVFRGCTSLSSIEFPSSVTTFGEGIFNGCKNLQSIKFNSILLFSQNTFAFGWNNHPSHLEITLPWHEGEVVGEPWGAESAKTTFIYTGELSLAGADDAIEPEPELLKLHLPLSSDLTEVVSGRQFRFTKGHSSAVTFTTFKEHACADIISDTFGLQCTDVSGIDLQGDISISFWFSPKNDSNGTWATYIRFGQKTTNAALNIAGRYQRQIYGGNEGIDIGQRFGDTSNVNNQKDNWFHHVVVYNRSTKKISVYLNNVLKGEQSVDLALNMGSDYIRFGYTNRQCDQRRINGFRIYQKALTLENIKWLYDNKI